MTSRYITIDTKTGEIVRESYRHPTLELWDAKVSRPSINWALVWMTIAAMLAVAVMLLQIVSAP